MPECKRTCNDGKGGSCCEWISYILENNEESVQWALARGMKVHQWNKEYIQVMLYHPCGHLQNNGKCSYQGESKPVACQAYPCMDYRSVGLDNTKALTKGCCYKFVDDKGEGKWEC